LVSAIDPFRQRSSAIRRGKPPGPDLIVLLVAAALLAAAAIIALTANRPVVGCAVLAVGIPLTTRLGRGTLIPLLRPNEAILLLVLVGLTLHYLLARQTFPYIGLDLAIGTFAVGSSLVPWLVLLFGRADIDFDTWRAVLGPLQFLAVYLCFAQLRASDQQLKWLLNVTLLVSVILAAIAILQSLDFPASFRALVDATFSSDKPNPTPYRPTSLLGNYGAVGAFAAISFILALTLASRNDTRLNSGWLSAVMSLNLIALVASLTWAPAIGVAMGTATVVWYSRRVPREIWIGAACILVTVIILWPLVSARIEGQLTTSVGSIQNVDTRLRNWQLYFLPVLSEHVWFGTGTLLPTELPPTLGNFVDNEYLRIGFRAGLAGLGLLIIMLWAVGTSAWRCRESVDPWRRRLGAVSLATVVSIVLVGFTAEYLSFGGLSQYIAMLFGLLAARMRYPVAAAMPSGVGARAPAPLVAS
jgi:hypothetical protein